MVSWIFSPEAVAEWRMGMRTHGQVADTIAIPVSLVSLAHDPRLLRVKKG